MEDRPIRILPQMVARKIAAGEVIDKPYAAVRELLDNAIDSGADEIALSLDGGGIDSIRVSDNGCGMVQEDLELCWLPHATSKIADLKDLERVKTHGFRGEALSSLAACARLEIVAAQGDVAYRLVVHGGERMEFGPFHGAQGTSVSLSGLFYNMPARRRFLGTERSEGAMCQKVFFEKTAAHPSIAFRYFADGKPRGLYLAGSQLERIAACWPSLSQKSSWLETLTEKNGFKIHVVHLRPEIARKDRKHIKIFVNRRKIDEFSLVHAVSHAYTSWMPGGNFPIAFVFIEVDPTLVDFNIHPAKKEVRFRNLQDIRHTLIEAIKRRLTEKAYQERSKVDIERTDMAANDRETRWTAMGLNSVQERSNKPVRWNTGMDVQFDKHESENFVREVTRKRFERFVPSSIPKGTDFKYLGQALGVFLVAESGNSIFIVDQHAAHERVLYEKFRNAKPESDRLLIPRSLNLDEATQMKLELREPRLKALGIEIAKNAEGDWCLISLPSVAKNLEDAVVQFLEEGVAEAENFELTLWADLSCKAAVKDKSVLDDDAANRLLEQAFALESPRCPHGRPLWFEITRSELFELVGRTV
ncbi:DNA mismatch repair protein MutL [Olavius algarvensis spirochete endosymbiont]|uniref:DNA mismatch repair endonuclease MutL n=1 Tax=Olavius algarvensis spirochete endosymbiont TaxID=260710 RepID=UPI00052D3533|nr:DNA mismatch repair endonuclease MutL [Olavius algarvensis spirochete endosymbiont]KGM43440.1 hypothetical protein JY97_07240 [Alkalispirochaeta odontotermitis]VDA99550.1 DNA mismatch repair protein MutL [Olavius algarvensis spirochete endosymbiont]